MRDLAFSKFVSEQEMAEYDSLRPELRAAVQEYGHIPWDPNITVEEYIEQEQRRRELEQEFTLMQLGVKP